MSICKKAVPILAPVCLALGFSSIAAQATAVVYTDVGVANTLTFRDYNGVADTNVSYGGPTPSQSVSGGVSTWTYAAGGGDPKVIYNDGGGTHDLVTYPWVRMRYEQNRSNNANIWKNPFIPLYLPNPFITRSSCSSVS